LKNMALSRIAAVSALALLLAIAIPASGFAQMGPSVQAGRGDPTAQNDYKVMKWALPTLNDTQVLQLLDEIEYSCSSYGVDFNFGLAVVAAEASIGNKTSYTRKRSWDFVQLMTKASDTAYPPVTRDLKIALSSLAELIHTEKDTESILRAYWADPERGYNMDTVDEFMKRVSQKWLLLQGKDEKQAQQNYIRQVEKFPTKGESDLNFSISEMPNLNKQLVKYAVEPQYADVAQHYNSKLSEQDAALIARAVLTFATKADVDPRLVMAVIAAESRFKPRAVSKAGAMGLAQLMPATARSHGIRDAFDPVQNIYVCVKYLEREMNRWESRSDWLDLVLASYNAGPGAVKKYGGVPPYSETRSYVRIVKNYYYQLRGSR
jgi:hypothetical protein